MVAKKNREYRWGKSSLKLGRCHEMKPVPECR